MTCGIYCIEHLASGRKYVGQSRTIELRWRAHVSKKSPGYIGKALHKHGKQAFSFTILEECEVALLNEKEVSWIKLFGCVSPAGFNLDSGGNAGKQVTEETRAKQRAAHAKLYHPPPVRHAIEAARVANTGAKRSQSCRDAIGAVHRGRKATAEAVAKMSAAKLGKQYTAEHRAAISAGRVGRKSSIWERCQSSRGRGSVPVEFVHTDGTRVTALPPEMRERFGLPSGITYVVQGKRKSFHGWSLA